MLDDLRADIQFFLQLRSLGQTPTWRARVRLLRTSRGLLVLASHRLAYRFVTWRPEPIAGRALRLAAGVLVEMVSYFSAVFCKCHVVSATRIEPGVYLADEGNVLIGARSVGAGTVIHREVTIGTRIGAQGAEAGTPVIGRNVWVGPGCVIFGAIRVGDGATILPETIVSQNVPDGAVMQGNPARMVRAHLVRPDTRRTLELDVHISEDAAS